MEISYKWLKEYVDFDLTPQETADALTSCGLEVDALEEVQTIRGGLKGLYVGKVLTCELHPNSDHLHITTVDLGKGEPQQIVCGAPNVAAGQKVIVADLGCVLYDGDSEFTIKKSKLRGVESFGMICAEDEIGVGTAHDGIIVLQRTLPLVSRLPSTITWRAIGLSRLTSQPTVLTHSLIGAWRATSMLGSSAMDTRHRCIAPTALSSASTTTTCLSM